MNDDSDRSAGGTVNFADRGLMSLAYPYALDAVSALERAEIDTRLQSANAETRELFLRTVHDLRETMAVLAAATMSSPPPELRGRILDALDCVLEPQVTIIDTTAASRARTRQTRWHRYAVAAVAAILVGLGGVVVTQLASSSNDADAEQILVAPDTKTVTSAVSTGGTATLTYSLQKDAALVRFVDVPPPAPGTVYQMWIFKGPPQSLGTITAEDLGSDARMVSGMRGATSFAITVEPAGGSAAPTSNPIAFAPLPA